MLKTIAAFGAAIAVAGTIIVVSGFVPDVGASPPHPAVKGDRLDVHPPTAACSQTGWPRYEVNCMYGRSLREGQTHAVRVIAVDRQPADLRTATFRTAD